MGTKTNNRQKAAEGAIISGTGREFSFGQIRKTAILYMALPLFCFCIGFLKWYFALVCTASLCLILRFILKKSSVPEQKKSFMIPLKTVILVFAFSLLWTYLGGMNGYYHQSTDWDCRNAIYFDLIQYKWPVTYDQNGAALVYYIGHWLPPAAVAKLFYVITGSMDIARMAGRMLLWIWSSLGTAVIILMIYKVVNAQTAGKRITATFLFVFFSGLDLLGAINRHRLGLLLEPSRLHLEWWFAGHYQYTSITACMFWVFNQAIIPWMITLCFLTEDDPRNYVYYCVVCLLCGTLPCVGLVILMIAKAIIFIISKVRQKQADRIPKRIFSLQNLLSFLILFPVIVSFVLSANTAKEAFGKQPGILINSAYAEEAQQTEQEDQTAQDEQTEESEPYEGIFSKAYINKNLLKFLFFEVALYMLLIWIDHRKNPLFYVLGLSFFFIPYFHVGKSYDFCMRASIPGIFILMIYVNRFLLEHFPQKTNKAEKPLRKILAVMLAVCFAIGMATSVIELYRGVYHVAKEKTLFLEDQRIMTFNQEHIYNNFLCSDPDNHLFFKYLAR